MAEFSRRIRSRLPTQRRLIQLYAALLYNAHAKGFITGDIYTGKSKLLCVPGLNCYSCPGAVGACPLGALQNAIASSSNRAPTYILGILLLLGLTLGRTICGFLCPMGLLQELLHKIPTPKLGKSRFTRALSGLKYVLLVLFVIAIPLWYAFRSYPLPAFCKYICPAGTLEGAIGLLANPVNRDKLSLLGALFTQKFVILVLVAAACVFVYRAFCRFLCPLGAIYGLFAKITIVGVKVDAPKCVDCNRCIARCGMDIRHVGDHECIHCGECIDVCPTGAISLKAGKATIKGPEPIRSPKIQKRALLYRSIAWTVAIAVLTGALIYFNRSETDAPIPETRLSIVAEDSIPVGKDVGMRAPDFTVPLYGIDDGCFTLSEHRGKTVVVNIWATWCTPCCEELPYFDALWQEHRENVEVIAIHSSLVTDDVEAYLSKFRYQMPFALDETGEVVQLFGGSTMLPQTIVISADGRITYNAVGSVTYEELEALIESSHTVI